MSHALDALAALRSAKVIDLTQALEEHMPHYPTHSKFFHNLWGSYWHGARSTTYQLVMNEHNGTHVDAPSHFISDAKPEAHVTIENVPVTRLLGRGVRVDCQGMRAGEYVSRERLTEWEGRHAPLEAGDIVLFDFAWSGNTAPQRSRLCRRLARGRHARRGVSDFQASRRDRRGYAFPRSAGGPPHAPYS